MDIFDRKDPKLPFKQLVQLNQVGTLEAYMLEFENILVMVSDVSISRLVLLFTEGLKKPLRGFMKYHKPATLKDAMNLTRDLQNVFPRTKYPPSQIYLPSSRKVRNHGKRTPIPNKIKEDQAKKNLE